MKGSIKKFGRCILALNSFFYDWRRYLKNNGWKKDLYNKEFRNYYIVKVYHTLEKSMSYKERRKGAAYSNAVLLLDILKHVDKNDVGYHDRIGAKVLSDFCNLDDNIKDERFLEIKKHIPELGVNNYDSGCFSLSEDDFNMGLLSNPDKFFLSRYSLREYSEKKVSDSIILKSLELAQKSPSSCNMQAWHTYLLQDREKIKLALDIQSGNKGFGHKVNGLLIFTCDQLPFISSSERYQHWIDGSLHAMSVVYALHSLGVASCCLNWSEDGKRDRLLRSKLNIKDNHSIIMMLSFGYPEKINKVCVSPRRPLKESYTIL